MPTLTLIQKIAVWVIPVLFAITIHEAAHAFVANFLGDKTAKMLGRLSLNPVRHIDPVGTILIPLVVGALSQFQFVFGWAKPVPINWENLKKPRRDTAFVAAAGPLVNIFMALLWAMLFKLAMWLNPHVSKIAFFLLLTSQAGILVNLVLALLNLIPIPPLDGSRILASLLPKRLSIPFMRLEPFGLIILLLLLFSGLLSKILTPVFLKSLDLISALFNL
ncbi:site-2 protease family protein [Legionella adelaidensis]|nr:site-2 protease family protein [Legionella adelaidensis]